MEFRYLPGVSLQTVEVELENGVVRPCGGDTLPAKARALLTIMEASGSVEMQATPERDSLGERMKHLCGIGNGKYTDLSTNKAHMDDLGE